MDATKNTQPNHKGITMTTTTINFPTRSISLSISAQAAEYLLTGSNWDLVVNFLAYGGTFERLMNDAEKRIVRLLGDGFGDLRGCDLPRETIETLLADWSHLRDSSEAAINAMGNAIRDFVTGHIS